MPRRHPARRLAQALVLTLLAALAVPLTSGSAHAWSDGENRVTFIRTVAGTVEVHTMLPTGRDVRQVTRTGGTDKKCDPAMSPDGLSIAYASSGGQLYVVPAAGGTPVHLTPGFSRLEGVRRPSWSKDGQSIAFHRTTGWNNNAPTGPYSVDLWVVRRSGTGWGAPQQLTALPAPLAAMHPRFSPNGESIAFAARADSAAAASQIRVMATPAVDAAPVTALPGNAVTGSEAAAVFPSWSPDGTRIAYVKQCSGGVWVVPVSRRTDGTWTGGTATQAVLSGACVATFSSTSNDELVYDHNGYVHKKVISRGKVSTLGAGAHPGW